MNIISRIKPLLKATLREPLVHFVVLGGLLFVLSAHFNPSADSNQKTIVITGQQIEQLHTKMSGLLKRELTPAEMQNAVDQYVTEEVLLREGLALGVVEEDPAMRKNVADKVKFLLSDSTLVSEPTEGMLQDFMQKHTDLFTQPPRRSFTHIYFDPTKHANTLDADIKKTKNKIVGKTNIDPLTLSDTFVEGNEYQQIDQITVARTFGDAFASALFAAPLNTWQGPITSTRGVHLVFISEEVPAQEPAFNEIREQVHKLYLGEQHRLQNEAAINQLKQQYQIIVEQTNTTPTK